MRSSAPWAYLAAVLLADPTAASGPGARGGAGGGSARVRAPAVETHAARMGAAELGEGAGAAGVRWHAAASLGKGVAALWVPPSPEPVHLDEPSHLALGGSAWQDEPADPLSPEEQAAAAEEERTMWRALLSAVSESGEVAVQFRDLVGDGDDDDDELACATDAAPTFEPGSPPDLQTFDHRRSVPFCCWSAPSPGLAAV
ncbi:hypothetical protein JCM9279_007078 [Rhodotorula babjevae]